MQYQIQGQPYPVVVLTVEPEETVLCQKGAMAWMTPNMEMQTKGGGLGKMFSRAFTGESMFQNHYTAKGGQGMIAFASAVPGEIMPVQISPERSIVAQKSAFLASEAGSTSNCSSRKSWQAASSAARASSCRNSPETACCFWK